MKRLAAGVAGGLILLCIAGSALAAEPRSSLMKAKSLMCEFGPGTHAEWKHGALVVESGRFNPPGEKSTIHYDSIDHQRGTARVIGAFADGLQIIAGEIGVTFVEHIGNGGLAITTVYGEYDKRHMFPAVLSKHVNVVGPFPSQFYGSCRVLQ